LEALTDSGDFVRWQVIGHNDAAGSHFGDQAFFEPLLEDFAGHRAQPLNRGSVEAQGWHHAEDLPKTSM
jgi:hypothetical protein